MRLKEQAAICVMSLGCCVWPAFGQGGSGLVINEFMADNKLALVDEDGEYKDWIELYNRSVSTIVLTNWYLTDDPLDLHKWAFCTNNAVTNIGAGKYLVVFASSKDRSAPRRQLHTNFKLGASGGYLGLVQGEFIVSEYAPSYPPQDTDVSYGLGPGDVLMYFSPATPGITNTGGSVGIADDPVFVPSSGLFVTSNFVVSVTSSTAGATINYTLDAEVPTALSTQYVGQITLTNSAVFRARASRVNYKASPVSAYTYISIPSALAQPANPPGWPSWPYYAMDPAVVSNPLYNMTNAIKFLPMLSLITAKSNLFDPSYGIYVNAGWQGSESYERPSTIEWVGTNGISLFKTDCGVRIQGGAGRSYKKHSFRFVFDRLYGNLKLNSDIFKSPTAATSFDTLVIRAGWNDAYSAGGGAMYFLDECIRRTQLAEGVPGSHGTYVSLYVDGLYWGVYNAAEKQDQNFAGTYFGATTNWDYICQDGAKNGDVNAWNQLIALCQSGSVSNEVYQKIQGNNPDRIRNMSYTNYLDIDNYIDYLMPRQWTGDWDWPHNNWHALRNRDNADSGGFRFVIWDAEGWALGGADKVNPANMTGTWAGPTLGAGLPYSYMSANLEFKLRFADHIYKHYFNGGALTTNQMIPRYTNLASQIEPVIMGENARWGNSGYTLAGWRAQRDNWLSQIPARNATVLQQYKNYGFYPAVDPPVLNQRGGIVTNGFKLTMTSAINAYYTLDGTDPRQYGTGAPTGTL
ncbi:MAG: CotH kinase family protein, partial [bacterium]